MPRLRTNFFRCQKRLQRATNKETWNVLSLYRPGALTHLIEGLESRNMGITAVKEIRRTGEGT